MEAPRKGSKGGRVAIYDESLKIAVCCDYHSGRLSVSQVGKKHGLDEGTVYHFLRWYKKHQGRLEGLASASISKDQDVVGLSKELAYAQLRITALELLLKNAEKEMGVDILKKHGTKR
jgi:transposase-like protein